MAMDETEKQERESQSINIKFDPFLTCSTRDCTNEATVGNASFDCIDHCWVLIPVCKECAMKMMRNYGVDLDKD